MVMILSSTVSTKQIMTRLQIINLMEGSKDNERKKEAEENLYGEFENWYSKEHPEKYKKLKNRE